MQPQIWFAFIAAEVCCWLTFRDMKHISLCLSANFSQSLQNNFFDPTHHLQPAPILHYHPGAVARCVRLRSVVGCLEKDCAFPYPHLQLEQSGYVTGAISPYHLASGLGAAFMRKMARDLILCVVRWDFLWKGTKAGSPNKGFSDVLLAHLWKNHISFNTWLQESQCPGHRQNIQIMLSGIGLHIGKNKNIWF